MSQNIDELFMKALEAYHPFISSENWKYSDVLTAFIHSVSAAYSAYKLSLVLGKDDDFAEKAFFIGLFHDFYQKFGKKVEDLREVVKMFVDDKEVLEGINYNLAENPDLNPKFGKIVWFADMMQSSNMSFLDLFNLVKKVDPSLNAYFFTVSLPQIGTRSAIMKKVVEKVEEMTDNSLIVLTKDGVVVITKKDIELPIRVNWDELKIPRDGEEWAEIEKRDKELINDFFDKGKPSANFKGFFYNVEVDGIEHKEGGERCFLCGIESLSFTFLRLTVMLYTLRLAMRDGTLKLSLWQTSTTSLIRNMGYVFGALMTPCTFLNTPLRRVGGKLSIF